VGGGEQDAAVIVAIGDYVWLPDVPGAVENGLAWEKYLSDARGVPSVRLLRNQKGTRESIETALDAAAKDVGPGGTLWFIFIGHGAASQDRTDGVLAGWDAQQELNTFYPNSVARADVARRLAGKGKQRVMVLDACFSGKTASGTSIFGDKQPIVPVQMSPVPQAVVLSAAASDEMAGGLPVSARPRPAFSYLVLGAMRGWGDGADGTAPDGVVDANEAVAYARKALRRLDATRQQTPEASGSAALAKSAGEKGPDLGAMLAGLTPSGASGAWTPPSGEDPISKALAAEAALKAQEEELRRMRAQAQTVLDAEVERDWARVSSSTSTAVLEAFLTKFADRRVGAHSLRNAREGDARAALARLKGKVLPGSLDGSPPPKKSGAGASPSPAAENKGTAPLLPEILSRKEIMAVVKEGLPSVLACKDRQPDASGNVMVQMTIEGSGRVSSAKAQGGFSGSPVGNCIERNVRTFRFPQFSGDSMSVNMPFAL
jgi:hypothetical protein